MNDLSCWKSKFKTCCYSEQLLEKLFSKNVASTRKINIVEVKKAIYYAKKYHGTQMRQSGEPYYSHPLEVAYLIADHVFETNIIVTSILHDTIEDTELTLEMVDTIFGPVVASQVEDLTRVKKDRKISSAEMVESLWGQKKYLVLQIKQFDRLHNMRTIKSKSSEKIKKIIEETMTTFLMLSAYFEQPTIENELHQLCLNAMTIDTQCPHFYPQDPYSY